MKKEKKNKKRNRIIISGIALIYFSVLIYLIVTVEKPDVMIVTPETASVTMDGISKIPITVQILDNSGKPMSGQEISYQYLEGSGKVTVVRSITLNDGISLGEYTTGYGKKEQQARILIHNETGLSKIIIIDEKPNILIPGRIVLEAKNSTEDILKNGLDINATLLDINGEPMAGQKMLFKMVKGNGGFFGFRMMTQVTNSEGKATIKYETTSIGDVIITVESAENETVFSSIEFTVK